MKYLFITLDPSLSIYGISHNGMVILESDDLITFNVVDIEMFTLNQETLQQDFFDFKVFLNNDLLVKYFKEHEYIFFLYEEYKATNKISNYAVGTSNASMEGLDNFLTYELFYGRKINKIKISRSESKIITNDIIKNQGYYDIIINKWKEKYDFIEFAHKRHVLDALRLFIVFNIKLTNNAKIKWEKFSLT